MVATPSNNAFFTNDYFCLNLKKKKLFFFEHKLFNFVMTTILSTPRPRLVMPFRPARPLTPKSASARRNTFAKVKKTGQYITTDEIQNIKKRKQILLKERSMLIAKIARYQQNPYRNANDSQNKQIADAVEQDIKKLRNAIEQKRKEIEEISNSDRAASITETQEESKILHLELVRMKDQKEKDQKELDKAEKKLDSLLDEYSPTAIWMMEKDLQEYKKKVNSKVATVDKLEFPEKYFKSVAASKQMEEEAEQYRQELMEKIKESDKQIKAERKKISELEQQLYQ